MKFPSESLAGQAGKSQFSVHWAPPWVSALHTTQDSPLYWLRCNPATETPNNHLCLPNGPSTRGNASCCQAGSPCHAHHWPRGGAPSRGTTLACRHDVLATGGWQEGKTGSLFFGTHVPLSGLGHRPSAGCKGCGKRLDFRQPRPIRNSTAVERAGISASL